MLPTRRASTASLLRTERSCVLAPHGMVAASVPRAAAAGVRALRRGGSAVDAAIAAAAMLCVVEPMQNGLGGDGFGLVAPGGGGALVGLNASGHAPAAATPERMAALGHAAMPAHGILAVTVPGVVHGWEALWQRFGRLPWSDLILPAAQAAEDGFLVTEVVAHYWDLTLRLGCLRNEAARRVWAPEGRAPRAGERFRVPALARSLRTLAAEGAVALYRGALAEAIAETAREEGGLLTQHDLAVYASTWVAPLEARYRDARVAELPPNGQGITALEALSILECFDPAEAPATSALQWHRRIEAVKLAMADRDRHIADPEHVAVPVQDLLDPRHASARAARIGGRALCDAPPGLGRGDTVILCAADAEGTMVAWIQSLFGPWGSGVGCGDTGIVLQNRGAGFRLEPAHPNVLAPRKRPLHTIIPALLSRGDGPWMAFGVMGGDVQPQAHVAVVSNTVDFGMNPQEAIDFPRFRTLGGARVALEAPALAVDEGGTLAEALAARGHEVEPPGEVLADRFGGGQAVARLPSGWLGASDRRKDGIALGLWDPPETPDPAR